MKNIIISSFFIVSCFFVSIKAQNNQVLITNIASEQDKNQIIEDNTQLQINSNNKAFLITRVNRSVIDLKTQNNTSSGMITYDVDNKQFYVKNDTGWVSF